jgi:gamma-glutamyl hercynylcysteine S-oxide synthase
MTSRKTRRVLFLSAVLCIAVPMAAELSFTGGMPDPANPVPELRNLVLSGGPAGRETEITGLVFDNGTTLRLEKDFPLFTLLLDDKPASSDRLPLGISLEIERDEVFRPGFRLSVIFRNTSDKAVKIENLVPLGEAGDRAFITAGLPNVRPHYLSRTLLYRPGLNPLGVVLPDNAWHLGFCSVDIPDGPSLTALARRRTHEKAEIRRWAAVLEPGGRLEYSLWFETHPGGWRRGLEIMFRERYLHDLDNFDDTLFRRPDLHWIRKAYLMLLQFAWDHGYYDREAGRYAFDETLTAWDRFLGGFDIYTIWPTWPRLGLDSRNQWDMYRELPGGLAELRRQVDLAHSLGKKYFISYNPWDESTRHEDHLAGLESMLHTLDADGIVLDTRGDSSRELQETADRVKPGIIMYSEGMAVPKDMPGIVSGRVHDALYMPPPLNLNKFIKPDFAIFRVLQLAEGPLRRESSVALFNGYGVEINTMRPGRPEWIEEELRHLGRTTKILRENSDVFVDLSWQPLIPTLIDDVWVNRWTAEGKTVFTVFSLKPDGFKGALFEAEKREGLRLVSLWNHEELDWVEQDDRFYVPVDVGAFNRADLGTRLEGGVDCVAVLPKILLAEPDRGFLTMEAPEAPPGSRIVVTAGNPTYEARSISFDTERRTIALHELLGFHEEKIVVQLFDGGGALLDQRVFRLPLGHPRLISKIEKTPAASRAPEDMVEIPAGPFVFVTAGNPDDANPVIPYPDTKRPQNMDMPRFYMDRYPVTNAQFQDFLKASKYRPQDGSNFLKHWENGKPPAGRENHPVVWISPEDARAYAAWAGKRLPTEAEWQYAAQGTDGRKFPWGNEMEPDRCNDRLNRTTPVDAYPAGASPFGVMDLVGNVWQLTGDFYDNGVYAYTIIRGGSHYAPETSVWYVKSGPLAVDRVQIHLLVAPGLDRSATVGFRCVKDAF